MSYRRIISVMLLLIYFSAIFGSLISTAQEQVSVCSDDLNIFLFEYNHFIWQEYSSIVRNATCDINYFWENVADLSVDDHMPHAIIQEYSDPPFTTPENFEDRTPNGACSERPELPDKPASYCENSQSIIMGEPIQFLYYLEWEHNGYGSLLVIWNLAHEWGHHIQLQITDGQTEFSELQAECFVGVYLQYAINNNEITIIDFTQQDWDALMSVTLEQQTNDADIGTGSWNNISYVDRGRALQQGYNAGLSTCITEY